MAFVGPGFPLIDVIAEQDVTIAERNAFRVDAQNVVLQRAMDKKIVQSQQEAVVRSVRPFADFAAGGVGFEQWLTAALVAGAVNTYINAAMPANQVAVFFGVALPVANPAISELRFRLGPAGASQLLTANIQHLFAFESTAG